MGSGSKAEAVRNSDGSYRKNFGSEWQRVMLGILTSGTSEIKTGSGEYGDETVADSIFPKAINNLAMDERSVNRLQADSAKQKAAAKAGLDAAPTDITDDIIRKAAARTMLRGGSNAMLRGK